MFGSPEVRKPSDRPHQPRHVTADLPRAHGQDDPLPADLAKPPPLEEVSYVPAEPPRFELFTETELPRVDPLPQGAATQLSQSEPRLVIAAATTTATVTQSTVQIRIPWV